MRRFTHLSRTLSLAYPAHRALFALVALAAIAGWVDPAGNGPVRSMLSGALTVALTWMLVRELDPDRTWLALAGAGAAGVTAILTGTTDVAALTSLLLASRVLVRSTGLIPRITDVVAIGLFAGIFARTPLAWAAGLAVACAVALDTNMVQPAPRSYGWLALAIGVAVTITAVFSDALGPTWTVPGPVTGLLGLVAIVVMFSAPHRPAARTDVLEEYEPDRVRATRFLGLAAVLLGTLAGGGEYANATWPAWIALVTAGAGAHLSRR